MFVNLLEDPWEPLNAAKQKNESRGGNESLAKRSPPVNIKANTSIKFMSRKAQTYAFSRKDRHSLIKPDNYEVYDSLRL